MAEQDKLYAQSRRIVESFKFDEQVAGVFDDMIKRSVPGYPMMLDMLGVLTENIVQPSSYCYDLGCSLGASTLAIRQNIHKTDCTIIAVDNSAAMIEKCRKVIEKDHSATPVNLEQKDILDIDFHAASLVSLNLTLQFIPLEKRLELLSRIQHALLPGGALFLSEKVCFEDGEEQNILTDLHHQFKKHQGYSDMEIAQKRTAIENVLVPESIEAHKQRLKEAGFKKVVIALQCFNFVSFIAYS